MKSTIKSVQLICLTTLLAASTHAIINVNFVSANGANPSVVLDGTASSAGVAPLAYTGTTWNDQLNFADGVNLLDSGGNTTSVGYTFSNPNGMLLFSFSMSDTTTDLLDNFLLPNDSFGINPVQPLILNLSGLVAGGQYDLAIVSQGDAPGQGGTFTIGSESQTSLGDSPLGPLSEGSNYVLFSNIVADGSGNIDVTWASNGVNTGFIAMNGFQLVPVPEPGTYALFFGLIAIGLCGLRQQFAK
ncbi:MAG: PEP-CTERM sorting domain-containing protein [Verrucomicrobiota bacterium]